MLGDKRMAQNYDIFFDNLIEQYNGYLHIALLASYGIDRSYAYPYIRKKKMKKVARGLYCKDGMRPDMMFVVCSRNSAAVVSHMSSAFVHGLIDKEPEFVSVSVPQGYNAMHLTDSWIHVYQIRKELIPLGRTVLTDTYGNKIVSYDKERTICDLIREREYKKHIGDDQIVQAIRNYFLPGAERDVRKLLEYSAALGIQSKISSYVSLFL